MCDAVIIGVQALSPLAKCTRHELPVYKGNATPVVPPVPHVVVPLGYEFTQVLAYQGGAYLRTVKHAIKSGGLLTRGPSEPVPLGAVSLAYRTFCP